MTSINSNVKAVITTYPEAIRSKVLFLRELIYAVAAETENITEFEETLKWNEPSYKAKSASTIRIA